ncbi:MAG: flagellar biosynthesis anti-sigma factor FlgM [Geobacteraceae bacterium GWC2_58_44]|nr:MAG: flagellar biosynthesis anti-sigma factor FlgM [Geobacteraceae bacterium GWC2_58_44]HBG08380.1 flagellar biosynthesis anti-sigma factor FlgM [Geobacter sp.]
MKIQTGSKQPAVTQQSTGSRADKAETGAAQQKAAAKSPGKKDSVELSNSLDTEMKSQQAEQAKRVASLKALLTAGKYQVSSREVAEKMLSVF